MERISNLSSLIVRSNIDQSLKDDIERQKIRPKNLQILEDHTRVMSEWKSKSNIDGEQFGRLIYGPMYDIFTEISEWIEKDPDFSLVRINEGDKDQQRQKTNQLMFKFFKRFPVTLDKFVNDQWQFASYFALLSGFYPTIGTKTAVHFFLYGKSILMLGTQKHLKFVERALRLKDIGCFGLTELAHGSNVQGCITTATFDEANQSFLISTPHEKGMKFWIGGAAQTSNMCVVAANLIVNGKNHGIHMFIVPLRDEVSHDILPGITIGDCGHKQGLDGVDNGFIAFRNVKIPMDNLLDRITQVSPNGNVTSTISRKELRFGVQLSALSEGRVKITFTALISSLKACSIVLRFAAVRRQFGKEKNNEMSLIEYPGYQHRVFPHVANFLIGSFSAVEINRLWQENSSKIFEEKNKEVKEMHALISIMKPIFTWWGLDCLNGLRMAMGGLGYSKHAEIGTMIADYHVCTTWEGENYILVQQTGKFLLDQYFKKMSDQPQNYKSTDYIRVEPLDEVKLDLKDSSLLECPNFLHEIMKFRAAKALQMVANYFQKSLANGRDNFEAFNECNAVGLVEACVYYGELYIYRNALHSISQSTSSNNRNYLMRILNIYVLNKVLESGSVLGGYLSSEAVSHIHSLKIELYDKVKYDIVKCMDDLLMENHFVISPFGHKDGNIYGRFISKLLSEKGNFGKPTFWREIWEQKNSN